MSLSNPFGGPPAAFQPFLRNPHPAPNNLPPVPPMPPHEQDEPPGEHQSQDGHDGVGDTGPDGSDSDSIPSSAPPRRTAWLSPTLASGAILLGFAAPTEGAPSSGGGWSMPPGWTAVAIGLLALGFQRWQNIRDKSLEKKFNTLRDDHAALKAESDAKRREGSIERDYFLREIDEVKAKQFADQRAREQSDRDRDRAIAQNKAALEQIRIQDQRYLVAVGTVQASHIQAVPADPELMAPRPLVRVLVIEDDPGANESIGRLLAMYGYVPIPALSLAEALQKLESKPELALLDLMLPDADMSNGAGMEEGGRLFLQHVRDRRLPVAVIVTTAMPLHAIDSVRLLNPDRVFIKPYDLSELLLAIQEILQGGGQVQGQDGGPKSG